MEFDLFIPLLSLFILSIGLVVYTYVGYPLLVIGLRHLISRPVRRAEFLPRVSLIICAYNEERDIAAKIENALALDYPKEKLEVIVTSDCSTDRTDQIVQGFAGRGVKLIRQPRRLGKTVAQGRAMSASMGEILVLSDATTRHRQDALLKIVRCFADPEVGCVSGQLIYVDDAASGVGESCRTYWSYEKALKAGESQVCSLIGASGCLYAVRASCYPRLAPDMIDDFVIPINIRLQGLRTVYEPEAVALEDTNRRGREEFRMRVRVIEQTIRALARHPEALNPARTGFFAMQLFSHKVLRYCVPMLLLLIFATNAFLAPESWFFALMLAGQIGFYLVAFVGFCWERASTAPRLLALPYYFVLVNLASVMAWIKFVRGQHHITWEPIRSSASAEQVGKV